MSIYAYWDAEDKQILRTDIVGAWTWEEYLDSMYKQIAHLEAQERVDHIVDLRHSKQSPSKGAIHQLRRVAENRQKNQGITVMVGANTFLKSLLDVFVQIYGQRFPQNHLVESLEAALALIKQVRDNASTG